MPYKVHESATRKQMFWHTARPDEPVPEVLPENWQSTAGRGLPVVAIPHYPYPCVLYLHPVRPFRELEHRDANFALVGTEQVPTEHLTKIVGCQEHIKDGGPASCVDCAKLLEDSLAEGWLRTPYLPATPAKPDADLYPKKKQEKTNEQR